MGYQARSFLLMGFVISLASGCAARSSSSTTSTKSPITSTEPQPITLATVCSTSLVSDPSCMQYCDECRTNKTKTNQQLTHISNAMSGASAGVAFAHNVGKIAAKLPASQALALNNCAIGVVNSATILTNGCMNENCMTSTSVPVMASKAQAVCTAAQCLAAFKPELLANGYFTATVIACSVGTTLATQLVCADYTFQNRTLPLQGAAAACRTAIDSAKPFKEEECPPSLKYITVAACKAAPSSGPRDLQNIQPECTEEVMKAGATGRQIGACAKICAENTAESSKACQNADSSLRSE